MKAAINCAYDNGKSCYLDLRHIQSQEYCLSFTAFLLGLCKRLQTQIRYQCPRFASCYRMGPKECDFAVQSNEWLSSVLEITFWFEELKWLCTNEASKLLEPLYMLWEKNTNMALYCWSQPHRSEKVRKNPAAY